MTLPATIARPVEVRTEIKRSVFLASLTPVTSVEAADAVVASIRKAHWDARHHCTALIIGPHGERQRSSDDGEPAGTAGVPMLEVLRHRDVTDVVAVVTRWFGGVKLGAGGLVRAYGSAVSAALDEAQWVDRVRLTALSLDVPHADAGRVLASLHTWVDAHGAVLDEPMYGAVATLGLRVAPEQVEAARAEVAALTAGAVEAVVGETTIVDRPRR
ncbi:YigZ family protein [Demequina sp. NBRC 110055]|uniref:IMPACT family protein n=1 Tax=Demequina sp. NBRC 110055 TaxID=1570344 RepID=UPI00118501A1|nr:YigZ family protein [Demequina sp. NBRC 110055]